MEDMSHIRMLDVSSLTSAQRLAAVHLHNTTEWDDSEGGILAVYMDGDTVMLETVKGENPYRWDGKRWCQVTLEDTILDLESRSEIKGSN